MARYRTLAQVARALPAERFEQPREHGPVVIEPGSFERRGSGPPLDEEALGTELADLLNRWTRLRVESDPEAASRVRAALDISRRDAADRDLWTFLNSTVGWNYCVWRWTSKAERLTRERVSGHLDRSALARLWWMAELVEDQPGDVNCLRILLKNSDRAVQLFERPRLLRRQRLVGPLLEATDRHFDDWDEAGYRDFCASNRAYFGVRLPEAIGRGAIEEQIERLANRTKRN